MELFLVLLVSLGIWMMIINLVDVVIFGGEIDSFLSLGFLLAFWGAIGLLVF